MTLDELNSRWEAAAVDPLVQEMAFDGDALILGAHTTLAKVGSSSEKTRLAALLTAAHNRSVAAPSLRHFRRALET